MTTDERTSYIGFIIDYYFNFCAIITGGYKNSMFRIIQDEPHVSALKPVDLSFAIVVQLRTRSRPNDTALNSSSVRMPTLSRRKGVTKLLDFYFITDLNTKVV